MKFGISFANVGYAVTREGAAALATLAEELGFESVWTVEHTVVPADYRSTYPYSPTGRMPGAEESPIPDPLVWLAHVGALTTTLRLATGILILPQRNPVTLAKELATLDVLSGGRVTLGVGVGWLKEEFDAIGVPFESRGSICDEHIAALRQLWGEGESTFHGSFSRFERAKSYPKPLQPGGIPIVVGGHTAAAARRAGRLGDGFFPGEANLERLAELFEVARRAAKDAGRDPGALELTTTGAFDPDTVKRMEDLGVRRVLVPCFGRNAEQYRQLLGGFAENVMARMG